MVARRAEWASEVASALAGADASRLVFLDESGANVDMCRRHGRARGGARCVASVPCGTPASTTVVSSVRLSGETAWATWRGGTTSERFLGWLGGTLLPTLSPGDVVVMDNMATHHAKGVRQKIEEAGCKVLYLPPYSPDLNPIEKMWSKVKAALRAAGARSLEGLAEAIEAAIAAVRPSDCEGWFRSCGYSW